MPEGYTVSVSGKGTSFVITNKLETGKLEIEKTFGFTLAEMEEPDDTPMDIPVIKVWDDNGNKDGNRPASVTVRLWVGKTEIAHAELTAENNWRYTFTGLPRYDDEEKIEYYITEDAVECYQAEINGYNIRNIYKPELTESTVRKVWNDNKDKNGLRPTSIYMTLSNGKTAVTTVLLTAANNWEATVKELPTKINGEPAVYTWKEQEVANYTKDGQEAIEGNVTTFTNKVIPPPTVNDETPADVPKNNTWTELKIDDYNTALGVDVVINHVGDCFD